MTRSRIVLESALGFPPILVLLLVLAGGPLVHAEELPGAREVLDRFVEAVGGRTVLEQVQVRHYRGTIVQDLSWEDPQHRETSFVAEADTEGRVRYCESASWLDLPEADEGEPRRKLRWIMHPRFALVVEEFFPELKVTGRAVREGRPVIVLTPGDLPHEHYALYFDEQTGLLSHVGHHNDVEDWRLVDGALFPARWVFGRKGGQTTYVFEEVTVGPAPVAR